ncbi:MAG: hypothetical protein JNK82_10765 [Myxococcaceae bacterium]|nr:hypothetical protein [Myxococcaceae bacterium]
MRRGALLLVVVALSAAAEPTVPGSTRTGEFGKAKVAIDLTGVGVHEVGLSLVPGSWYELQTHNLRPGPATVVSPDTVLSVVHVTDSATFESVTIAGADGCSTPGAAPDFARSCVRFQAPSATTPGSTTPHVLAWVRAYDTGFSGIANVRLQQVSSATQVPTERDCTVTITTNCWRVRSRDASFGGLVMSPAGTTFSGLLHFETTHLPGTPVANQSIWLIAGKTGDLANNWKRLSGSRGRPSSHRRAVAGTAEWLARGSDVGLSNALTVVAGVTNTFAPIRLIQNDVGRLSTPSGVVTMGVDNDSDELGADLERVLQSCDSTTSPEAGGLRCADRPGCGAPGSVRCKAALRDSDGDGIRDDVELYGVDQNGIDTDMPRFGADPARYDVFVQLDYSTCVTPAVPPYTHEELDFNARAYRSLPGFKNRDGTTGIFLHMDAAVAPGPTRPGESAYGSWSGPRSTCVSWPDSLPPERRWLFRHLFRYAANALGKTDFYALTGAISGSSTLGHELGHQGGLEHFGPIHAPRARNGMPLHFSRTNYLYQSVSPADLVSFSDGRWANRPLDPRRVDESCPLGRGAAAGPLAGVYQVSADHFLPGCTAVDWNRDGQFSPPGTFVHAPLENDQAALSRHTAHGLQNLLAGGDELAVAGTLLYWFKLRFEADGTPTTSVTYNRGIRCDPCPQAGPDLFPPCWDPARSDPSLNLTHADGTPLRATALAAKGFMEGLTAKVVVVYVEAGDHIGYGLLESDPPVFRDLGPLPNVSHLSDSPEERIPDVTLSNGGVTLTYTNQFGQIIVVRGELAGGGITWVDAVVAVAEGEVLDRDFESSPAITTLRGVDGPGDTEVLAVPRFRGTDPAGGRVAGIELFKRTFVGAVPGPWSAVGTVPASYGPGAYHARGRPSLEQSSYKPGEWQLSVAFLANSGLNTGRMVYQATKVNSLSEWLPATSPSVRAVSAFTSPLVFDNRPTVLQPAMRGVVSQRKECGGCPAGATSCEKPDPAFGETYCHENGRRPGIVFAAPFVDGIAAIRMIDRDERPTLRNAFCWGLRSCEAYYGGTCTPAPFFERDESGTPLGASLCDDEGPFPVPACEPNVPDADGDGFEDRVDACPQTPAGPADSNVDGCPG